MKPAAKRFLASLALLTFAFVLGGCGGIGVSGPGFTSVYGDYGYVGPWDNGPVVVEGGYFVAPPRDRSDRDRRDDDRRKVESSPQDRGRPPEHASPDQHAAPAQRAAPRSIPSIPTKSRPAPQRSDNGKDKH
jgi:hypothetical protein